MKTQCAKWGNSLAVRIPQEVARSARLHEGDALEVTAEANVIIIKQTCSVPTLKQLVEQITPENLHGETDWGRPAGREAW
jgi:antitoxin MazE